MNMYKGLKLGGLFLFLACLLGVLGLVGLGCKRTVDFPNAPKIYLQKITQRKNLDPNSGADSIKVEIRYEDGDGDLGLSSGDTNAEFAKYRLSTDNQINRNFYNLYISLFIDNGAGRFDSIPPVIVSGREIAIPGYSRFVRLLNTKGEPIEGVITYDYQDILYLERFGGVPPTDRPYFIPGRKYFFKIRIADRALNKSNVLLTDTLRAQ